MKFFLVPDCSLYSFFSEIPDKNDLDKLSKLILKSFKNFSPIKKIRLFLTSDNIFNQDLNKFLESKPQIKVNNWNTNFFTTHYHDILSIYNQNNSYYDKYFEIIKINNSTGANYQILKDFILTSFGRDYSSNPPVLKLEKISLVDRFLPLVVSEENLSIFLIKDKDGEYIASFSIYKNKDQLQLHSVSGFKSSPTLNKSKKLPIISWAVCKVFFEMAKENNLSQLIFTSSKPKLVENYLNLGFKISSAQIGKIIELI